MKDLSLFFLKNSMGSKIRKSFRNICKNNNSTSTLNQHHNTSYDYQQDPYYSSTMSHAPSSSFCMENDHNALNAPPRKSVTLEEMILQLELEEEMARKEKAINFRSNYKEKEEEIMSNKVHHRMSCVNSSDILRSARNALNQYPRFSLDGRDSMYRASFRPSLGPSINGLKLGKILHLPQNLGGESVVWCKPGVVPKLMGLEAMPVPLSRFNKHNTNNNKKIEKEKLSTIIRNQNLRRRTQKNDFERRQRRHVMDSSNCCGNIKSSGCVGGGGASSRKGCAINGYCITNPIALEPILGLGGPVNWPNPYK